MIQRIQTVYLFLITVLSIVCLSTSVGHFSQGGVLVGKMYNLWLTQVDGTRDFAPWAMFALLLLVATLSFFSIFLYKRRMLQVRISIFNGLLLVGYYIAYAVFVFILRRDYEADFTISWTASLPIISVILDYLAFRAIMKDELTIRSLDRLR